MDSTPLDERCAFVISVDAAGAESVPQLARTKNAMSNGFRMCICSPAACVCVVRVRIAIKSLLHADDVGMMRQTHCSGCEHGAADRARRPGRAGGRRSSWRSCASGRRGARSRRRCWRRPNRGCTRQLPATAGTPQPPACPPDTVAMTPRCASTPTSTRRCGSAAAGALLAAGRRVSTGAS